MKKEMICISCPLGCPMTVEYVEGAGGAVAADTISVSGNSCARGIIYAKNEVTAPKRIVTTTLRVKGGGTVPVKTSNPVPKAEIFAVLEKLKGAEITPPVKTGQALVKDISAGVDIVATAPVI